MGYRLRSGCIGAIMRSLKDPNDTTKYPGGEAGSHWEGTDGSGHVLSHGIDQDGNPVKLSVDFLGRQVISSQKGAFGELITSEATPVVHLQWPYNVINTRLVDVVETNGGTVTAANSMATVTTDTQTGSIATMSSKQPLHYNPGQGAAAKFTALFTTGVAGTLQQAGIGNVDDGFFIEINGTEFCINHRRFTVDHRTAQADFSEDTLDGTGPSGMTIDITQLNVFEIKFQYLGAGAVEFLVEEPASGLFFVFHKMQHANSRTTPTLSNPSLPMTIHVENGATTEEVIVKTGSWGAFIEGRESAIGPLFGVSAIKTGITTEQAVITLRNKSLYNTVTNRQLIQMLLASVSVETGNKITTVFIKENVTLGGTPSFTDIDATNSTVDYDTAGTTVTGGDFITAFTLAKDSSDKFFLEALDLKLLPGDTLTISAFTTNAVDVAVALTWKELI